jgi:hypothetical protein
MEPGGHAGVSLAPRDDLGSTRNVEEAPLKSRQAAKASKYGDLWLAAQSHDPEEG